MKRDNPEESRLDRIERELELFIQGMRESLKRRDEQLDRTDRQLNRTDRQILELRESQKRTDRQILELRESQKQTDEQLRQTGELLDRTIRKLDEVGRQLGDLGIVQGEVAEDLFYLNLKALCSDWAHGP